MPNDEILSDDYVAGLLSQEANDCSLKYSALGMEAFRNNKRPANMPTANKRFLRHIIKDTDTHNKAMLAKEAAESRARLQDLEHAEEAKRLRTRPSSRDIRKRQMGDIQAILGGKGSKRDADGHERHRAKRVETQTSAGRDVRSSKRNEDLFQDQRRDRKEHGRLNHDNMASDDSVEHSRRREHRSERRRRSRSPGGETDRSHRHSRRRRSESLSSKQVHRADLHREKKSKHGYGSGSTVEQNSSSSPSRANDSRHRLHSSTHDDSDPLEDLIGPQPLPKYRGRGTLAASAGIDRRFSESYDPSQDMAENDGNDGNWDDAVEAFRDAQKLKQHQTERLRAANFSEDQISRAVTGDSDGQMSVQWSKPGEKREWDRGKEMDLEDA